MRPSALPVEEFSDSYIGREAVRFIDGYDRDEPMALFVGFGGPHEPWDAPGEYATLYDPDKTPPRIRPGEPGDRIATMALNHHRHLELYYAVPCTGAVLHPINVRLSPDHIIHTI